ncbi:hypothetical protein ACFYOK_07850 [Microbispora bryophytorum]|uniref:hypothetical protein n=1 Tax=Microbispora bryophytorum TaxID=1460882 RepID=UPI0033CC57F9
MDHVLCGLAENPALPSDLVDLLVTIADEDIASNMAWRADLTRAQAVALVSRVEDSAARLAERGLLTAADIDPVAQPLAALALLTEGAGRPEWARLVAADPDAGCRERLAACPGLPTDVAETLAADTDIRVVAELALSTTSDMAARLAEHPHAEVRRAVAANEATPPSVLAVLLTGEGLPPARRCLVCDRKEPPFVHDPDWEPDCELPSGASCDGSHESTVHDTQQQVLRNPATPAAAEELAASPDPAVRMLVAERRDLPSGIRDALAADPDAKVLKSIAPHPGLSEARLRAMVDRHGVRVLARVARNPDASAALLEDLVRHRPPVKKAFREVARHPNATALALSACLQDWQARPVAAGHPALPPEVIVELLADDEWQVVEAAAANPSLPLTVMSALLSSHGPTAG